MCSFLFQIRKYNTITTINPRSECLRQERKILCVTTYLETKSFKTVQAIFRRKLNFNNYPQSSQIYRCVHKFQAIGSVINLNKKTENPRSGKKLFTRCSDNVDTVRDSFGRSPKKSLRRRSQELGLLRASVQRILKKDFQQYPYRFQIERKLTQADMQFLVSVINHYHINGLHQFWDTLYIHVCVCVCVCAWKQKLKILQRRAMIVVAFKKWMRKRSTRASFPWGERWSNEN